MSGRRASWPVAHKIDIKSQWRRSQSRECRFEQSRLVFFLHDEPSIDLGHLNSFI
jgi:hypothetical protein